MAYFANIKGGIPFHKREEERRWNEHLKKHQKFVSKVKPTVQFKNDSKNTKFDHIRYDTSKARMQRDRLEQIEYENNKLLEKIDRVERRANITYNDVGYMHDKPGRHNSRDYEEGEDFEQDSTKKNSSRGQKSSRSNGDKSSRRESDQFEKKEQERIAENMRLNKKLKNIKEGKGRISADDPDFDPELKWWVSSPRSREKAKIEKEAEQVRENIQDKRKENLKKQRQEEEKLAQEMEEKEKQKAVPAGYHTKFRKKKKSPDSKVSPPSNEKSSPESNEKSSPESNEKSSSESNKNVPESNEQ